MNLKGRTYTIASGRCKLCRKDRLVAWSGFLSEPHICLRCLLKKCGLTDDEQAQAKQHFHDYDRERLRQKYIDLDWWHIGSNPEKWALGWSGGGAVERIIATTYQWAGDDPSWGWKLDLPRYRVGGQQSTKEESIAECEQAIREYYRWEEPI